MKIEVMTSFSVPYYERLGKYSVASFLQHWPKDISLTVYSEGFDLGHHPRIQQIPLASLDHEYHDFQNDPTVKDRTKTFAKKGYAWVNSVLTSDADYLVWLDADVMTKQSIPRDFLEKFCDPAVLSTFMGAWYEGKKDEHGNHVKFDQPKFSSETCVYFFNLRHPAAKDFALRYKEYYTQKLTQDLRRFIDTDVFGACVLEFQSRAKFNDINPDNYHTPLPRTELHPYLQHLKAKGAKKREDLPEVIRELIGPLTDGPFLSIANTSHHA